MPELEQVPGAAALVPNAAVRAWERSPEELLELVRRQLRDLPPPSWSTRTVRFKNHQGPTEVELHVATADPDADGVPVSAWLLLIDEVFPHRLPRGAFVVLPDRHSLIVALNEEREVASDPMWAMFCTANKGYDEAYSHHRGTRQLFVFGNLKPFRTWPWPERWTRAAMS